jgi:hypothetical protein
MCCVPSSQGFGLSHSVFCRPFVVAYVSGATKQILACSDVVTVAGPTLRHMKPQSLGETESLFWNESLAISVAANQSHAGDHLVLRKVGDARVPEQAVPIPERTPCVVSFQGKQAPRYPGSYFVHYVCSSGETLTALGPIAVRSRIAAFHFVGTLCTLMFACCDADPWPAVEGVASE